MADVDALSRLVKKADAVAESASVLVERTIRDIRGEIANLSEELNLAGSAADREKAYAEIRRRMAKLSRRLDALMATQNELAGKTAAKQAAEMTGLEVKYSAKRAEAITELVTPKQGENLAAVFTQRMAASLINSLQAATVAVLRQQAVEGGTMREMTRELARKWREAAKTAEPKFTDASGRTWDTKTYLAMNVRTNTMRVYNDCLLDDIARTTGSDIARISDDGGDPHCVCAAWAGCVISISGKTKGLPTYEQARNGGCFHPNCVHTLEYIDEDIDAEEIALAKAHPVQKGLEDDPDAQYERRREIDIDRKMHRDRSISRSDAELLVDRDNLTAAIRSGLIRSDARKLVDALTDAQVKALMTDNRPPRFEPTKKATKKDPHAADEKWIHGKRGGVVHISRTATVEDLVKVTGVQDAKMPEPAKVEKKVNPPKMLTIDSLVKLAENGPVRTPRIEDFKLNEDEYELAEEFIKLLNRKVEEFKIDRFERLEFHRGVDWGASVRFGAFKINIDEIKNASAEYERLKKEAAERPNGKTQIVLPPSKEQYIESLVVHEIGHWVQQTNNRYKEVAAEFKKAKRDAGKLPSIYAKTNEMEFFAEVFTQYHYDKSRLTESQRQMVKATLDGLPEKYLIKHARLIEQSGKSDGETIALPPISQKTADEIAKVCGITPKSLTPTVCGDEIRHSFNRHGQHIDGKTKGEMQKNQVPITSQDIARICEILESYDRIEKGTFNKTDNADSIKIIKNFNDGTSYTIFANAETLKFKTMWKKKN